MSLLTESGHISVRPFAKVPALGDLPEIQPSKGSVSNVSSRHGTGGGVDFAEGCIITRSVKYTHQLVHWVNAVRKGDPTEIENLLENRLGIVPYSDFRLDDSSNLAFLEAFVHTSLDLYAFIAVTPSSSTLDGLITMVKSDNDRRQRQLDNSGFKTNRSLNFFITSFEDPEYELVALHPEHFLPFDNVLLVCDPVTKTRKTYVAARDRVLRESYEPNSTPLPRFHHIGEKRGQLNHLNVFLVALNADIKFRRYFEMVQHDPPTMPLPDHVLNLMHRTTELIELVYWEPVATKGSYGAKALAQITAQRRQNPGRLGRPNPKKNIERRDDDELDMDVGMYTLTSNGSRATPNAYRGTPWPKDADIETRMAIGRSLMCGHDRDYDPELFEGAYPLGNDGPHPYSVRATVDAWNADVYS